jgi:hypothetical protein
LGAQLIQQDADESGFLALGLEHEAGGFLDGAGGELVGASSHGEAALVVVEHEL